MGRDIIKEIMDDLGLEGESKMRLLTKLAEQYDNDERIIRYKAKRIFITDRYKNKKKEKAGED